MLTNHNICRIESQASDEIPPILEEKGVTEKSLRRIIAFGDNSALLRRYKDSTIKVRKQKKRLDNPVNSRTRKPLKKSTIADYRSRLNWLKRHQTALKGQIQLRVYKSLMGSHKTRERWILACLSDEERRFVKAFHGSATQTARALYPGNYVKVRQAGSSLMKRPGVSAAILHFKLRKINGKAIILGGGQGNGIPFNLKSDKTSDDGTVRFSQYIRDIKERLKERLSAIFKRQGEILSSMDVYMRYRHVFGNTQKSYDALKNAIGKLKDDLDWDRVKKDYEAAREMLIDVEGKLDIKRIGYEGY